MNLEAEIIDRFDYKKLKELQHLEHDDGNHYYLYETETSSKIFVHVRQHIDAWPMFEARMNGMNQIRATNTIHAPEPIGIFGDPTSQGAGFVSEYIDCEAKPDWKLIGRDLAALHFDNYVNIKKSEKRSQWVGGKVPTDDGDSAEIEEKEFHKEFGFISPDVPSIYGKHEFVNLWEPDWVQFFSQRRLEALFRSVINKHGDREIVELWSNLSLQLDRPFAKMTTPIVPALLHGDLDFEKVASFVSTVPTDESEQDESGEPPEKQVTKSIVLEPVSFYGHSEFDLAKIKTIKDSEGRGDFPAEFYEEYHKKIKKQEGFEERSLLYQLFFTALDYEKNQTVVKSLMRKLLE